VSDQNFSTRSQLYWNTLLRIPSQIIAFVASIFVARMLDPKDYGIMGIVMMIVGYSNQLTNIGFSGAVIQKRINDDKIINSIFTFDLTVSSILVFLFFILSGSIAEFFKTPECKEVIMVMSLVFVITSFTGMPTAILKRDMDFKTISLFDLTKTLLMSLTTLLLAMNHFGYWALALGQLIPLIIITFFLCIKAKWFPVIYYKYSSMKGIVNFGMWNFFSNQLGFIAQHTDKFIIGRWLGTASLGFYDKAINVAEMPYNSLIVNINGVMFSAFSRAIEDKKYLHQQFKKGLMLLSYINFPIYAGLIVIAPYFVNILLGNKWLPMTVPFQIILVSLLIKSFGGLSASLNVGIGAYKEHTIRLLMAMIVFIIMCLILLRFAIIGIAASYFIYSITYVYLWMELSISNIGLSWGNVYKAISHGLKASIFMFSLGMVMANFIFINHSFMNMICIIFASSLSFCLYFLLDKSEFTAYYKNLVWSDIKKKLQYS
jgi:O-antigen/teichoic acid export membrane protein